MIWNGSSGSAMKIATARVATMTLPPPTAISRSAPPSLAACGGGAHRGIGRILLDAVKDAGIAVAEGRFDAPDGVGAPVDGWRADHEGALCARSVDGLLQALLDHPPAAVQTPRVACRPECASTHCFFSVMALAVVPRHGRSHPSNHVMCWRAAVGGPPRREDAVAQGRGRSAFRASGSRRRGDLPRAGG